MLQPTVGTFPVGDTFGYGGAEHAQDRIVEEPFRVSVVVCVYNEEQNLPHFVQAIRNSQDASFEIKEIIFVTSGCTDRSVQILQAARRQDPRIRILVQPTREGKASALRAGLTAASEEILLIENADTVPAPGALAALIAPFSRPGVSLVCSHPVPAPGAHTVTASLARILWEVHDSVSAISPKAGEAFAIRRMPIPLPADIEDDDTFVGIYVGSQGGHSQYARDAVVFNRVPNAPSELIRQRYRINRQILGLWKKTGFATSTWNPGFMVRAVGRYARQFPRRVPMLAALMLLEGSVRIGALFSVAFVRRPLHKWAPIESTKRAIDLVVHSSLHQNVQPRTAELGK